VPVFGYGRWWTVLSAGWLHAGLLHILFNMLWLRQLAPAVASVFGPSRMMILYVVASALGFGASTFAAGFLPFLPTFLRGAPLTVGASAGVFGLLGAIVSWGRRGGSEHASQQAWSWAILMFLMGFFPGLAVDNWAHFGGFAGGYVGAIVLHPQRRETAGHAVIAIVCLAATLVSIAVSFFVRVPF
jgi:rhomboid protease GluP